MSKCGGTFKENNRCYFPGAPPFIFAAFSQNLKRWQRILKATQGIRCCEFQPSAPPDSHTLIKSVCSRQCLQIFLLRLASTHISPVPLLVSQSGSQSQRSAREATEKTLKTDSKLRETPLIRAALWLHTALFTLVSLTHRTLFLTSSVAHC